MMRKLLGTVRLFTVALPLLLWLAILAAVVGVLKLLGIVDAFLARGERRNAAGEFEPFLAGFVISAGVPFHRLPIFKYWVRHHFVMGLQLHFNRFSFGPGGGGGVAADASDWSGSFWIGPLEAFASWTTPVVLPPSVA